MVVESLKNIELDLRGSLDKMIAEEGFTLESAGEKLYSQVENTFVVAMQSRIVQIALDPNVGISFVLATQDTIGVWNKIAQEFGFKYMHVRDIEFVGDVLVKTLEETFEKDIDEMIPEWLEIRDAHQ